MRFYADTSVRRTLQIVGDLGVVAWIWVWVTIAHQVHDATLELATPGHKIDRSATDLAERLRDAGRTVANVPLVGEGARRPFDGAGSAASGLADAGQQQVAAVETLANWLGLAVALIPVLLVVWFSLFALRALSRQPLHVLARISADPAGAWRRREPDVVDRLARLELASVGLHAPAGLSSSGRVGE